MAQADDVNATEGMMSDLVDVVRRVLDSRNPSLAEEGGGLWKQLVLRPTYGI